MIVFKLSKPNFNLNLTEMKNRYAVQGSDYILNAFFRAFNLICSFIR